MHYSKLFSIFVYMKEIICPIVRNSKVEFYTEVWKLIKSSKGMELDLDYTDGTAHLFKELVLNGLAIIFEVSGTFDFTKEPMDNTGYTHYEFFNVDLEVKELNIFINEDEEITLNQEEKRMISQTIIDKCTPI